MTRDQLPDHSPIGASAAYRWMACPGSVYLSDGISNESSEFAAEGTIAHSLAEYCLTLNEDAWTSLGNREEHTKDMVDAVQVYLDEIRTKFPDRNQGNSWIERSFHCPSIHDLFFGTADFVYYDEDAKTVHVYDYKHGAGIVIEVPNNPQLMYYAVGVLEDLRLWDKVDTVTLHVAQPRGWHPNGPIRHWSTSTEDLSLWMTGTLLPAMELATVSHETSSGDHCRFCPARGRACPQLLKDMEEMEELMATVVKKGGVKELSGPQIGRFLTLYDTAKLIVKEAEKIAFSRLQAGKKIPGRKLAAKRSNRKWKDAAETELRDKFGEEAFTEPKLKTPAQIDELPQGAEYTSRWSFKPEAGLVVVSGDDKRTEVSKDTKSLFTDQTKGNN